MEILTILAPQVEVSATVELPARVVPDVNGSGKVQATFSGRVEPGPQGLPVIGQQVERGQVLAFLLSQPDPFERASREMQLAELELEVELAEAQVVRLTGLAGAVPEKERFEAQRNLAVKQTSLLRLRNSLVSREPLSAPVSGVVSSSGVVAGEVVQEHDLLFEIIDPGRFMVEALSGDPEIALRIKRAYLAGDTGVDLAVLGVGRSLHNGLIPIMLEARGAAGVPMSNLVIGQAVTVIATLEEQISGIRLPAAAVVQGAGNAPTVWIKLSAERFLPQSVEYQTLDAESVVVTKGLAADNRVVVSGASLLAQIR